METSRDLKPQPRSPEEISDAVRDAILAILEGKKPSEEVKVIVRENRDAAQRIAMDILTDAGIGNPILDQFYRENNYNL